LEDRRVDDARIELMMSAIVAMAGNLETPGLVWLGNTNESCTLLQD
jgi:hypothetical protein